MELTTSVTPGPLPAPDQLASLSSLAQALAQITDPRAPRGRRYSLVSLLLLVLAGLLCQMTSLRAIARWGRLHAATIALPLGFFAGPMPCCATIQRLLRRLDAQELDQEITTWLRTNTPLAPLEGIAVDGKTLQGVPGGLHLLEAVAHKENEIVAAPRILQVLDLKEKVVTGDALLAQRSLSQQILEQGGDYFWVSKDNQPTLKGDIQLLFTEPPFGEVFDGAWGPAGSKAAVGFQCLEPLPPVAPGRAGLQAGAGGVSPRETEAPGGLWDH